MKSLATKHQYKDYDTDQQYLMPLHMRDWLPQDHMVFFIIRQVEAMDLSAFDKLPTNAKGQPPYHYRMMVTIILYAYSLGITSSRIIEQKTYEESAFRIASGDQHPDFRTISTFRKDNLPALSRLFTTQLLYLHHKDLLPLEVVSQDGTKIQANASSHKNLTYAKMLQKETLLTEAVRISKKILADAEEVDRLEDRSFGKKENPYLLKVPPQFQNTPIEEMQKELKEVQDLIDQTREENQTLQQEQQKEQQNQSGKENNNQHNNNKPNKKPSNKPGKNKQAKQTMPLTPHEIEPDPTTKRNRTDFDSRLMKSGSNGGYFQAYNVQLVMDHYCGLIAGIQVTQDHNDQFQTIPMMNQIQKQFSKFPEQYLADKGYSSENILTFLQKKGIDAYVATKEPSTTNPESESKKEINFKENGYTGRKGFNLAELMRLKLKTTNGKEMYKIRGWLSEGPFGYLKQTLHFTQFSFRGKEKVEKEALLRGLGYNLCKLYRLQLKSPFIREKLSLNPG